MVLKNLVNEPFFIEQYLILSTILFFVGLFGVVLSKRDFLVNLIRTKFMDWKLLVNLFIVQNDVFVRKTVTFFPRVLLFDDQTINVAFVILIIFLPYLGSCASCTYDEFSAKAVASGAASTPIYVMGRQISIANLSPPGQYVVRNAESSDLKEENVVTRKRSVGQAFLEVNSPSEVNSSKNSDCSLAKLKSESDFGQADSSATSLIEPVAAVSQTPDNCLLASMEYYMYRFDLTLVFYD